MDSERCARFPICLSGESILQLCEERFYGTICLKKLLAWKNSPYLKPLILKGVRQVGKTWILKEFGGRCYENTAYFNFDEMKNIRNFLKSCPGIGVRTTRLTKLISSFSGRTTSSQWRSNPKLDDDVLNIPLFMADQADRLIGLALEPGNAQ